VQNLLEIEPSETQTQTMISKANDKRYDVGLFYTPTLGEMRKMVQRISRPGKLKITHAFGDVADKQSDPENRYATFQVASQFNCLEFVGPAVTPEHGVTGYINDRTQGPACSISCGPATVFRNYFAKTRNKQYGQTKDDMIDCLRDVSKVLGNTNNSLYEVKGGYTLANNLQLKELNATLADLKAADRIDEVRKALRVGVHEGVQVTSTKWGKSPVNNANQKVTQVFASACAVAYNLPTPPHMWKDFASLILEASYEATLCAAIIAAHKNCGRDGSNKVFLTLLGGGVFGNDIEWIVNAIRTACQRYEDYALDVRVVTYAGKPNSLLAEMVRRYNKE